MRKPFVIAEVGSNFKTKQDCIDAIGAAIACDADAVKFQLFSHRELYGYDGHCSHELDPSWLPDLAEACGQEIEFMCTAFSPEGVAVIDPYVQRHKVASSDMEYTDLLDRMRETEKPLILSTGGHTLEEVAEVVSYLSGVDLTLLYCESSYPSTRHNLNRINLLKTLGYPVGFSDHSLDVVWAPLSAVQGFGVHIIEKHFNPLAYTDTPDAPHALSTPDFFMMVSALRDPRRKISLLDSSEMDMRLYHNRRLTEHGMVRVKPPVS